MAIFTIIGVITVLWAVTGLAIFGHLAATGRFHAPKGMTIGAAMGALFSGAFLLTWMLIVTGRLPRGGMIEPPKDWEPPHE